MKVVGVLLGFPSFLAAGCLDASPEKTRVIISRIFFTLNLVGLGMYLFAVSSGVSEQDDVIVSIYGRSFTLSTIAMSAIGNLVPFGAENLVLSLLHPGAHLLCYRVALGLSRLIVVS